MTEDKGTVVSKGTRSNLQAFQQRLSERIAQAQSGAATENLRLSVTIAGQTCLFPLSQTQGVIEITQLKPVPLAKPWLMGVVIEQGEIYSVIDPMQLVGAGKLELRSGSKAVVVSPTLGLPICILVDRVNGLVNRANFKVENKIVEAMSDQDEAGKSSLGMALFASAAWSNETDQVHLEVSLETFIEYPELKQPLA